MYRNLLTPLHKIKNANPLLSLDFSDDNLLGPNDLLDIFSCWPEEIIALNLTHVGSLNGPDVKLLTTLKRRLGDCKIYAGGGVRNLADLQELKSLGVAGTLIAKSLHTGTINSQQLAQFTG